MILTLCYGSYFSPHYLSPLRVNLSYPSLVLIQLYVTLMRLVFSVKSIRVELHSKTDHLSFSASLLFSLEFIVIFFPLVYFSIQLSLIQSPPPPNCLNLLLICLKASGIFSVSSSLRTLSSDPLKSEVAVLHACSTVAIPNSPFPHPGNCRLLSAGFDILFSDFLHLSTIGEDILQEFLRGGSPVKDKSDLRTV